MPSEMKISVRIPRRNWRRWPNSEGYWLAFRYEKACVWMLDLVEAQYRGGRLQITEDDEASKLDKNFWFVKFDLQFQKAKKHE